MFKHVHSRAGKYIDPEKHGCEERSCTDFDPQCKKCTKYGCEECNTGYKAVNGACVLITCSKGQYKSGNNCYACSGSTYMDIDNHTNTSCKTCPSGQKVNSSKTGCESCSTIAHCTSYDSSCNCNACEGGYEINNGGCSSILKTPESSTDCPGAYTYYYRGMCVTTRNAGDEGGPSIDIEGVKVVAAGTNCSNLNCCCRGEKTVASSKAGTGLIYNPQGRTACAQEAARLICASYSTNYAPEWSLPTESDLTVLNSADSTVRGIGGLEFCQLARSDSSETCNATKTNYDCCVTHTQDSAKKYCKGAKNDGSSTNKNKCNIHNYHTEGYSNANSCAKSVRCVAKKVYK